MEIKKILMHNQISYLHLVYSTILTLNSKLRSPSSLKKSVLLLLFWGTLAAWVLKRPLMPGADPGYIKQLTMEVKYMRNILN